MAVEYKEKRRFPRFVCDTGVRVHPEIGNAGYWGTVGDISLGGCYVFTFSPLPAGQVVTLDIKAGDKVLFGKYAGTEIKLDGEEYLILREDDVLGVVEGAAKGKGAK